MRTGSIRTSHRARKGQDFTPWMAAKVDALGSALGLSPLTVQRTEAVIGAPHTRDRNRPTAAAPDRPTTQAEREGVARELPRAVEERARGQGPAEVRPHGACETPISAMATPSRFDQPPGRWAGTDRIAATVPAQTKGIREQAARRRCMKVEHNHRARFEEPAR